MKFILNQEGVLEVVKENKVKEVAVRYAKPFTKTVFYGAAFYIGYHILQFLITGGLPGFDFALHEVMELLGFGSYFTHPFSIVTQAKSF